MLGPEAVSSVLTDWWVCRSGWFPASRTNGWISMAESALSAGWVCLHLCVLCQRPLVTAGQPRERHLDPWHFFHSFFSFRNLHFELKRTCHFPFSNLRSQVRSSRREGQRGKYFRSVLLEPYFPVQASQINEDMLHISEWGKCCAEIDLYNFFFFWKIN